jgi:chromosome segregation ATPase
MELQEAKSVILNLLAEKQACDLYLQTVETIEAGLAEHTRKAGQLADLDRAIEEKTKEYGRLEQDYIEKVAEFEHDFLSLQLEKQTAWEEDIQANREKCDKLEQDRLALEAGVSRAEARLEGVNAQIFDATRALELLQAQIAQVNAQREALADVLRGV